MDKHYDFPVYRSDANDPEEKNSPGGIPSSANNPHPSLKPVSELVRKKEAELKFDAERKLVEASEKNSENHKARGMTGRMADPRHEIA